MYQAHPLYRERCAKEVGNENEQKYSPDLQSALSVLV